MDKHQHVTRETNSLHGVGLPTQCGESVWRSRLGFVVPASNAVVEYEIARMLPHGVSAHFARSAFHPERKIRLGMMIDALPQLARDLVAADMSAISFACTTGSFSDVTYEPRALNAIRQAGCLRAATTTTAVLKAITALTLQRVTVITPYPDNYNDLLCKYLEVRGIDVTRLSSLYSESAELISPESLRDFCLEHADRSADGLFIACTKLRTLEIIDDLEAELQMPVFSSIGATLWQLIGDIQLPESPLRPGRLFGVRPALTVD